MNVFVAGPRALSSLDKNVKERLKKIIDQDITVLVGDAKGIDTSLQQYFYDQNYQNVQVYASQGIARNNIGKWPIKAVAVPDNVKGFYFYAAKDKEMSENADYGFMLWNGTSKGTLNNIINLAKQSKTVLIYFTPHKKFYCVNSLAIAQRLANSGKEEISDLFSHLFDANTQTIDAKQEMEQLSLF